MRQAQSRGSLALKLPFDRRSDDGRANGVSVAIPRRGEPRPLLQDRAGCAVQRLMATAADDIACGDESLLVNGQTRLDRTFFSVSLRARGIVVGSEDRPDVALRGGSRRGLRRLLAWRNGVARSKVRAPILLGSPDQDRRKGSDNQIRRRTSRMLHRRARIEFRLWRIVEHIAVLRTGSSKANARIDWRSGRRA